MWMSRHWCIPFSFSIIICYNTLCTGSQLNQAPVEYVLELWKKRKLAITVSPKRRILVERHYGRTCVWCCQWVPGFRQSQSYWDPCFPAIFLAIFQISPSVTAHNLEVTMDNLLPFTSHCQTDKIMRISLRIHLFLSTQATQMLVQHVTIPSIASCRSSHQI